MNALERKLIDMTIELEELRPDALRWRKTLGRVHMMIDAHGTKFYVRAKPVSLEDCSVAEHFTAAIDAAGELND